MIAKATNNLQLPVYQTPAVRFNKQTNYKYIKNW